MEFWFFFKSLAKVAVEDYSVLPGKQAKLWFQDWDSIVQWNRNVHVTTLYMKKSLLKWMIFFTQLIVKFYKKEPWYNKTLL